MKLEDACDLMDQINKIKSIKKVDFTGGEPFIDFTYLLAVLTALNKPYRIFSNGFWGKDPAKAKEIARELVRLKYRGKITLSTSREHQRFVPLSDLKSAINVLMGAKIPVELHIIAVDEAEFKVLKSGIDVPGLYIKNNWRSPNGRSSRFFGFDQKEVEQFFKISPCGLTPAIYEDGAIMACPCNPTAAAPGSPLILGNVLEESLKSILDRSEGLLSIIRTTNHFKILVDFLADHGLDDRLQPGFSNSCELCRDIFNNPELTNCILDNLNHLTHEAATRGNIHDVLVDIPGGKKLLLTVKEIKSRKWDVRNGAEILKLINACVTNAQFVNDHAGGVPDIKNKILPLSILSFQDAVRIVKTGLQTDRVVRREGDSTP